MARTSSLFGMARSSTRRPTGTIMAPPTPWRKRAATKASSERLTAQHSDPTMNTAMALANVVRAPTRSATQPLMGMKTARLIKYEVSASLSAMGSTARSRAIMGSAVDSTVASMFSMNSAQATISGRRRAGRRPGSIPQHPWGKTAVSCSI